MHKYSDNPSIEEAVRAELRRVLFGLHPEIAIDGSSGSAIYVPESEHRGAKGWVHGGFIATLLDHVCARVARSVLDSRVATGTLDLRYRRPVLLDGGPFALTAEAEPGRSRTVRVHGALAETSGEILAEANGLFVSRGIPLDQ